MDGKGNESSHLMLITPERVFYAGLLGRPRQRASGALHVYVAIEGGLRLSVEGGSEGYGELAAVLPNVRHTIASDCRSVICLMIEPETVGTGGSMRWRGACRARNVPSSPTVSAPLTSNCCASRAAARSAAPRSISCASATRCRGAPSIRA